MSDSPVRTKRDGAVLEVTLDRPKANAIDAKTSRLLGESFAAFRDDPELRVAIITGGGERFFCAGWDLIAAAHGEAPDSDYGVGGFGGIQELPDLNKPIIAAEHVRFALPEIRAGTLADAATLRLPKRIPYHIAMELLLLGRWMEAAEAHRLGLVNELVPAGELMVRARALAAQLADGPPLVFAAIKEVMRDSETQPFREALRAIARREFPSVARLYASADHAEGARAFAEKRAPRWQGR